MPARLFVASGIFHPESGGPATYLYHLLPALQDRDWQIRVLSYGDADDIGYPYPVQRIPRRFLPLRLLHYAAAARPALQWSDLIYQHTIDLPLPGIGETPRLIKIVGDRAWERAVERGWIRPTEDIDVFQTRRYSTLVDRVKDWRARQVRGADGVIVPSHYLRAMVAGWGVPPERIHVIYNALPPLASSNRLTRSEARRQLNLPDAPLLLTAARLTPWKGIDHLIRAVRQIPDVHLLIAGDGSQRADLERLAADGDRVRFLGQVPRATLETYMQAADYVALYSGYEGLPHTLLESLRLGTPVIASDKGGNPEVVRHGENGLLVPYIDTTALVDTLKTAFAGDLRQRLAAQTAQGLSKFTFETMIENTHQVLSRHVL